MKIYFFWTIIAGMTVFALFFVLIPLLRENSKIAKFTAVFILVSLPISAFLLYLSFGSSQKLAQYWQLKKEVTIANAELKKIKNPQQVINKLQLYLNAHPRHARGWYLLGKLEFGMRHYQHADAALQKAHQLKPGNKDYAIAYAEAYFFLNKQNLSPQILQLLRQIIQHHPNNVSAINLLAVNAYLQKHYQQAVKYWEQLLPFFPAGSENRKILLNMIGRAQSTVGNTSTVSNLFIEH